MQSCHAVGLRRRVLRLPGVEPEMVVVAAGRDEQDVAGGTPAGNVACLVGDVEAEEVDVERADTIDVGGAEVHMADAYVRVDHGSSVGQSSITWYGWPCADAWTSCACLGVGIMGR